MYQIDYTSGYQLTVTLSGNGGRVSNSHNQIVYEGSYDAAVKWLSDRCCVEAHGKDPKPTISPRS